MTEPARDRRHESGVPIAAIFFGVAAARRLADAGEPRPLEAMEMAERMRAAGKSEMAIYRATNKVLAGTEYAGVSYDAAGQPRFEVSDATAKLKVTSLATGSNVLGNVLEHAQSERAMPGRDILPVVHDSNVRGAAVAHDSIRLGDGMISKGMLGGAKVLKPKARGALLHEEQHVAQIHEGRPGGGTPDDFARDQTVTYKGKTGTLKGSSDEVVRINRYESLAGEQEAELTRARENMTAEQRRAQHPDGTFYESRVPRSEQIVTYDSDVAAMADIEDFGEKIGGARKDSATKTGRKPKTAEPADTRPGWMKRFVAAQELRGGQPTGQWTLLDTRKKNRYTGGAAQAVRQSFASQAEAERAIPLLAVSQKHYVRENYGKNAEGKYDSSQSTYEVWRKVSDRKQVRAVAETFPTREAAMRYMAENAPNLLGTAKGYGEEILAKPEKIVRKGPEWRKGDVDPSAFAKELGYRGVEFGNWQGERGQQLNMAYDAMRDLADITGVKPESLTLQQRLALAFGARGHGGKNAGRAHYEPQRAAINLTKEGGAGTLAHEWWHAADHHLAQLDDPALGKMEVGPDGTKVLPAARHMETSLYASQRVEAKRPGQLNDAVRQAYKELMETMLRKPEQVTVEASRYEKGFEAQKGRLAEQIKSIRDELTRELTYGKRNTAPASADQLAKFDEVASKILAGEGLDVEWKFAGDANARLGARGSMTYRYVGEALDAISNLYKEVRGRSGFDNQNRGGPMDRLAQAMKSTKQAMTQLEQAKASPTATVMTMTDFMRQARKLDEARTTPYWQTRHELAARAFEAYIQDKMAAAGRRSDYLSWGADNALYSIFEEAKPYPEGAERAAINAKFDKLFEAMKQAEVVAPAAPVAPAALAASDDIATAMQGAKGQQGWTDEARIASADARDVARPGEAKPAKTGYKPTDKWTDAEKYVDHPNGERTIAKSWIRAYEAEIRGLPDTDPTKPLRMEHAQILAGTRWRADGTAYSPALLEAAKAEVKAQQDAAFGQSKRGQRARKDQQAREATVGDNGGPSDAAIKTAEKLEAVARRTIESSQKEVNAPRLMNTARRARMGSGVIEQHQQNIADARTALKIAEALRNGEAGALANVKSLADVRELRRLAKEAEWATDRAQNRKWKEGGHGITPDDARNLGGAKGYVRLEPTEVERLRTALSGTKGLATDFKTLARFADQAKARNSFETSNPEVFKAIANVANAIKKADADKLKVQYKHEVRSLKWQANKYLEEVRDFNRQVKLAGSDPIGRQEALKAFLAVREGKVKPSPAVAMEQALIGQKIPGFFPTPESLAKRMAELADIQKGQTVLEPSAGTGRLAAAAAARGAKVEAVEMVPRLQEILKAKGLDVVDSDFTAMKAEPKYDRVLMNPPFEKGQDMAHVRKAFEMLKPGGKMVAVMGEGAFFRSDRQASEFRQWLEGVGGMSEKLPEGTFKESNTGVNTRLVTITKPAEVAEAAMKTVGERPGWSDAAREASAEVRASETSQKSAKPAPVEAAIERAMRTSAERAKKVEDAAGNKLVGFQNPSTLNAALKAQGKAESGKAKPSNVGESYAPGTRVKVAKWTQEGGDWSESATIVKNTKGTVPKGYHAVRFDDGGSVLVPNESLRASNEPPLASTKTVAELKSEAKAAGIKGAAKMSKGTLLAALGRLNDKAGTIAMIGAPVAAAAVAFDATRSQAKAAGDDTSSANIKGGMAAAAAGGTTAAVIYGMGKAIGFGLKGVARLAPAAAGPVGWAVVGGLTAYGAYRAYQTHKDSGRGGAAAALSLVGLDEALHLAKPRNMSAGPTRITAEQAQSFKAADEAHAAMRANQAENTLTGFQNPKNLASAMAAQGKAWDGNYGKKP